MNIQDQHPIKDETTFKVGFLLVDQFTLISLASAIEPLRMANHLSGRPLYDWQLIAESTKQISASGGAQMQPDTSIEDTGEFDLVLVVAGINVKDNIQPAAVAWLQRCAANHTAIGGLCTGAYMLAQAGLLNGYACSAHWECLAALQEEYPLIHTNNNLFTFDRDRITCTGGDVSLHMMLHLIASQHGRSLTNGISDMFVCDRIRDSQEPQRVRIENHVLGTQPKLANAVQLMETNIEEPIELTKVAELSGISRRQLERLFLNYLGVTPSRFYLKLRLERALQLLRQTSCPIIEIAGMCGFESTTSFNRAYRKYMGRSPKTERDYRGTFGSTLVLSEESVGLLSSNSEQALEVAANETSFGLFHER